MKRVKIALLVISVLLTIVLSSFQKNYSDANDSRFRKNVRFNHLFVVIDDSTFTYLFDSLQVLKKFAATSEQTTDAGSASWTGKYLFGRNNYLEIFKPGGMKGGKLGDFGIGFMTDKLGTLDSLHSYWKNTLDSVHEEKTTTNDDGNISPWFTSLSIPNIDSLKINAWVFENSKEEMTYAGFTEKDLQRPIGFSEYDKHITAKLRNVPVDSVKYGKLFDKIISLKISLSTKELSYLKHFLRDIGFTEHAHSFTNDDLTITYSLTEGEHFLVKEIGFSLLKTTFRQTHSFRHIDLVLDNNKATMKFKYE